MEHHTTIHQAGEGGVQALCSCGWRSPVFGTGKTAGHDRLTVARRPPPPARAGTAGGVDAGWARPSRDS